MEPRGMRGFYIAVLAMAVMILMSSSSSWEAAEALGVNWGTVSYNPLPNSVVVQLLKDNGLTKVKLFDADPNVIQSMKGTSNEVMVSCTNDMLAGLAASADAATAWVKQNVSQYIGTGGVNIKYAAVGNEPFLDGYGRRYQDLVLPALKNIQAALAAAGLTTTVKAVVPCNADVLSLATYPSQVTFRSDLATLMMQIVAALASTGSPFVINFYPFLSLYQNANFPIDYAFFAGTSNPVHDGTLVYTNVFDASYDGLVTALTAGGYPNMSIIVGEIGWPTDGTVYANVTLAQKFNQQLVNHMLGGGGTPLRPNTQIEGYLFSLLDEDAKSTLPGPFERHWGVFNYDGSLKYPLDLTGGVSAQTKLVAAQNVVYYPSQWCVLNPSADQSLLATNVDYACAHGDCTPLENGGSCSGLTSAQNASYAFNNYYQFNDQNPLSCNFQGVAQITTTDPSVGTCKFIIGIKASNSSTTSSNSSSSSNSTTPPAASTPGTSGSASSFSTLRLYAVVFFTAALAIVVSSSCLLSL